MYVCLGVDDGHFSSHISRAGKLDNRIQVIHKVCTNYTYYSTYILLFVVKIYYKYQNKCQFPRDKPNLPLNNVSLSLFYIRQKYK